MYTIDKVYNMYIRSLDSRIYHIKMWSIVKFNLLIVFLQILMISWIKKSMLALLKLTISILKGKVTLCINVKALLFSTIRCHNNSKSLLRTVQFRFCFSESWLLLSFLYVFERIPAIRSVLIAIAFHFGSRAKCLLILCNSSKPAT